MYIIYLNMDNLYKYEQKYVQKKPSTHISNGPPGGPPRSRPSSGCAWAHQLRVSGFSAKDSVVVVKQEWLVTCWGSQLVKHSWHAQLKHGHCWKCPLCELEFIGLHRFVFRNFHAPKPMQGLDRRVLSGPGICCTQENWLYSFGFTRPDLVQVVHLPVWIWYYLWYLSKSLAICSSEVYQRMHKLRIPMNIYVHVLYKAQVEVLKIKLLWSW